MFHYTTVNNELLTPEERIKWAVKNRKLYVFSDAASIGVSARAIVKEDDDDDIRAHQEKFERVYREKKVAREDEKRKEEKRKLEEEKRKEEERLKERENEDFEVVELLRKYSHKLNSKANITTFLEESTPTRPKGSAGGSARGDLNPFTKKPTGRTLRPCEGGQFYASPCAHCDEAGIECREQIPKRSICTSCLKSKIKCSLNPAPKYSRKTNKNSNSNGCSGRKNTESNIDSEEDELLRDDETRDVQKPNRTDYNDLVNAIREFTEVIRTIGLESIKLATRALEAQDRFYKEQAKTVDDRNNGDGSRGLRDAKDPFGCAMKTSDNDGLWHSVPRRK